MSNRERLWTKINAEREFHSYFCSCFYYFSVSKHFLQYCLSIFCHSTPFYFQRFALEGHHAIDNVYPAV